MTDQERITVDHTIKATEVEDLETGVVDTMVEATNKVSLVLGALHIKYIEAEVQSLKAEVEDSQEVQVVLIRDPKNPR